MPFKVTITGKWWRRHCLNIHYAIIAITRVLLSKNMHKRNFGGWGIFKDSQNVFQRSGNGTCKVLLPLKINAEGVKGHQIRFIYFRRDKDMV